MLYKLKNTGGKTEFVPVTPTTMAAQGLLEKTMEQWLSDNPYALLPEDEGHVLVILQESPFQNLTDILAVDRNGNLLVIEVKRGQTPRDVIAQALEYAAAVAAWDYQELNQRAVQYFSSKGLGHDSLLAAFQQVFGVEPGDFSETQFNQQQRILIVGETIESKIERTARWLLQGGIDVGCLSYTCYRTTESELFLEFQEVVRREEAQSRVAKSVKLPSTEDEIIQGMPQAMQAHYMALRERVAKWPGVQSGATSSYLKFVAGNNFAEMLPRKSSLRVHLRPEGFHVAEGQSAVVHGLTVTRLPATYSWTCNHWFTFDATTDLDAAEALLRQSYTAVHSEA